MLAAYQESFEKYQHRRWKLYIGEKGNGQLRSKDWKKKALQIYENYYVEEDADTDLNGEKDSTVRVYKNRSQIDLVCLMKGSCPRSEG